MTPGSTASRPVERWTLALLMVATYSRLGTQFPPASARDYDHPEAPAMFRLLFSSTTLQIVLLILLVVSMLQFARRRRPLLWGTLALVIGAFESESRIALSAQYEMEFASLGGVLAGWLLGLAFARDSGLFESEEMAVAGARGAFAAMYLTAGIDHVRWWVDTRYLIVSAVVRRPFRGGMFQSFFEFHLRHPLLTQVMAVIGVGVELSGFLFLLGPRPRAAWGTLVILFHLYAYALLDLKYLDPIVLALAFSYPWHRKPDAGTEAAPAPARAGAVLRTAGRIAVLGAFVMYASSWPHHASRSERPPDAPGGSQMPDLPR